MEFDFMGPKYSIGEIIKNTDSFGDVKIKDILHSPTTGRWCYVVEVENPDNYLICFEIELAIGVWPVKEEN